MRVQPEPHEVRTLVVQSFRDIELGTPLDLEENILIDEGRYFGRSYRAGDLMAMWMIEVGLVQFYNADGNMLKTINLFEEAEPLKMAA
jgi:hypothetical protein